jgi:hypothetical protein
MKRDIQIKKFTVENVNGEKHKKLFWNFQNDEILILYAL